MTTSTDLLHRFIFDECDIRGEIVTLGESYRQVLDSNDYPPAVQHLLGEFLAAVALLSSSLKFDGLISLQARGEGAISLIMAECSHDNQVRGIIRPRPGQPLPEDIPSLAQLLEKGVLVITLEPKIGERYQGIVPLDADTLAGCLEHYFKQSEQLETRFWIAADEQHCAGLLLQALPLQVAPSAEVNRDNWQTAIALAETVTPAEQLGLSHPDLLHRLFNEMPVRLFSPTQLHFHCSCSRERSAAALESLGREEVEQLLAEKGTIEIDCQFCNQLYRFNAEDVRELFGTGTLH
ncbi:Hsp33 family molecular chaperone HslO [Gilvimarinus xylanilyticus]|uniref:33 kDa chaperonin n=1 Tax=Gilvimarinus xylanilyticus TaxID=2944139 RepID=A0A9X2I4V5_9GAMM|nr:Hsp33 family molecular chaperone HslO [Gilvimarinus xylanilyticus]MCP8900380.1 Hsp33 family molecular chaperone HslO [Gilvimarinus xylanilyticus]